MTEEMPEGRKGDESQRGEAAALARDVASHQARPGGGGEDETPPDVLAEVADEMGAGER